MPGRAEAFGFDTTHDAGLLSLSGSDLDRKIGMMRRSRKCAVEMPALIRLNSKCLRDLAEEICREPLIQPIFYGAADLDEEPEQGGQYE